METLCQSDRREGELRAAHTGSVKYCGDVELGHRWNSCQRTEAVSRQWYEPVLRKSCWWQLKRKQHFTPNKNVRLKTLLQYNLKGVRAYLIKEFFHAFWDFIPSYWGENYLERWCTKVMRSQLEPMNKVVRTIRRHQPLILNWSKAKKAFFSGIVEGLNNKIKLTQEIAMDSEPIIVLRSHNITHLNHYQRLKWPTDFTEQAI